MWKIWGRMYAPTWKASAPVVRSRRSRPLPGIYLEALFRGPVAPLFLATIATAAALPFVMRWRKASVPLMLAAFMLCGAFRLALVGAVQVAPDAAMGETVYEGLVVESSARSKVLSLSRPATLEGMRVAFMSGLDLDVSQVVRLFGTIRPLVPTFKNPGNMSWRWLKKLEGVGYEVKGTVLSVARGDDPVADLRRYFKENIERSGAVQTDMLKALTIGDRTAVPQEKNDLFLHTGTSHILAVSGFNVSIISGFFFFIARSAIGRVHRFRLSGRDTRYASLITMPFPFLFMLVAGSGVSVIRSAIMVNIFMLSLFIERRRDFYNTMALAALVILILYPHSLLTPSFQLTFMSLLFIVMVTSRLLPALVRIKNRFLSWSCATVLSTAAATMGTAPIALYYFYGMNPLCIIHNLVTIPLMGVAATGLSIVGMVHPWGRFLLVVSGWIVQANLVLLHALDFGYLYPLVRPTLSETLLYYCLIVGLLHVHRKPVAALLFCVVIPLSAIQVHADYRQRFNTDLRIHVIDVGLGDSALIEAPGGLRILIDGGGFPRSDFDTGRQVVAPFLLYRKIRTIDYVINTHPHADHIGGLPYIVNHFKVAHVITAGLFPNERKFMELLDAARSRHVPHEIWKRGDGIGTGDFRMTVLHPAQALPGDNLNDTSLVFKVRYGNRTFLLPADITADIEEGSSFPGFPSNPMCSSSRITEAAPRTASPSSMP